MGFRSTMRTAMPPRKQIDVIDQDGLVGSLREQVRIALVEDPSIKAVYSMYSMAHAAVIDAFASLGRTYSAFIAHDLNHETTELLRQGHLSAVLHHDLKEDMRRACQVIMQVNRALPGPVVSRPGKHPGDHSAQHPHRDVRLI